MSQQQIVEVLRCGCKPGFEWKSKATYKAHFKSQRHTAFDTNEQELNHRKSVTRLTIELDRIKHEHGKLKELYMKLLYENDDLKGRLDGIRELYSST